MNTDQPHDPDRLSARASASEIDEPLSAALKHATRDLHRRAETTGFIRRMIRRQATRDSYICYLGGLLPIYAALESRLGRLRSMAGFEIFSEPGLARRAALEADLAALTRGRPESGALLLAATENWTRRVSAASTSQLVAHAYVRYLGDLNGGLIVKRLLREPLELGDSELGFYEFPGLDDVAAFRDRFRASLDSLGPNLDCAAAIAEARRAFELAVEMSVEIEERLFGATDEARRSA